MSESSETFSERQRHDTSDQWSDSNLESIPLGIVERHGGGQR